MKLISLPLRALANWFRHGNMTQSAALAFYTLFSLLPTLLIALYLASLFIDAETVREIARSQLEWWAGSETAAGIDRALGSTIDQPLSLVLGGAGFGWLAVTAFLLGATAFFAQLEEAFNRIWETAGERKLWRVVLRQRFIAGVLILAVGAVIVVLAVVSALVGAALRVAPSWLPSLPTFELASVAVLFLALSWILRTLPARRVRWRAALLGSAATTLLLWLSRIVFAGLLLPRASSALLGATTGVVTVLVWVYVTSMLVLLGGEMTCLLDAELPGASRESRSKAGRTANVGGTRKGR